MSEAEVVDALILDLLEWLADHERSYDEVMGAWRTSCPKLTVWEDATDLGLVEVRGAVVAITPTGKDLLARKRG
jgi:hypothetical protein